MMSLGYDEVAKICLTHSFNNQTTKEYIGKFDVSDEELNLIKNTLAKVDMSDYDRLIQLCDSLAGSEGVLDIEERMGDVKQRYGYYPQGKWDSNIRLKKYFEEKAEKIYMRYTLLQTPSSQDIVFSMPCVFLCLEFKAICYSLKP